MIAQVREKEKAKQKYEDAMGQGHATVFAERKKDEIESMMVKLGNLMPLQEATLKIQLIVPILVKSGSYKFTLPTDFYPDYRKMGAPTKEDYSFSFAMQIKSSNKIAMISKPEVAECTLDDSQTSALIKSSESSRAFSIFYRTHEMMYP